MKKFGIISALAIAALFTSCNEFTVSMDETQQVESKNLVFSAKIGDVATKTAIDGVKVKWEEGDEIAINGSIYVAQVSPKDPTMASFIVKEGQTPVEEMGVEEYYAVYPATSYVDAGMVSVSNEQVFNGASLANVNPMFAHTTSTTLDFHNVCGLLAFNLLGENSEVLKSVTVSQPFDEERESNPKLAGMVNAFMEDGEVVVEPSMLWFDSITISFENHPLQLSGETQTIYVAVPAQTYPELVITVNTVDQDARFEYVATKAATVKRNTIHRLTFQTNIKTLEEATVAIEELEKQFTMVYNTTVNGEDYTTGNTYSLVVEEYTTKINEIANAIEAIKAFRDEHYEAGNLGENLDEIGMKIVAVQESLTDFLNDFAEAVAAVDAAYEEVTMAIEDEQGALTALMMLTIYSEDYEDEIYDDIKDLYTGYYSAIGQNIEAIQQWALESYEAGTIIADSEEIIEALEGISPNSIMMQINSAASGFMAAVEEVNAYVAFAAEFENLQQQWTMIYNATVGNKKYENEKCEPVIEEMTPALNGIQQQMQTLLTWADESYEAGTLAADLEEIFSNFEGIQILLTQFYNAFNDAIEIALFSLEINVTDITPDSAVVTFVPSTNLVYYLPQVESTWFEMYEDRAELAQADLDYFRSQYGSYASLLGYNSFEEFFFDYFAENAEYEMEMTKLDPETTYHAYAFAVNSDYTVGSEVFVKDFTTPARSMDFYGTAVWHDVFVSSIFDMDGENLDMPCDVYTDPYTPGVLYFDSPYNYANIASWFETTPENMKQYNGNWKRTMLAVDCSDPSKVKMAIQDLGVVMSSSYGWVSGGFGYGYTGADSYGVYADNTITFSAGRTVLWQMSKYQSGKTYSRTLEDNFTITITPGGQSVAPEFVKGSKVAKLSTGSLGTKEGNFELIAR